MNRMTLEQANEHFKLQFAAKLKNEALENVIAAHHRAAAAAWLAEAALYNFEADLEKNGVNLDENS